MLPTSQTSTRTLIPINVETLVGTSFELLVSPYEQIQSIKRKIERREGIPSLQQHLVFKTDELEDESCLNDYNIEAGTTIKLVLDMRGGPVNTKRVLIEDNLIRDMSEYIENSQDDYGISNDLLPSSSSSSSNKNVTFLVLRDGDQFNFFQVLDRGDGTLSPLSGSISAGSMYNTHDPIIVESERKYDEKRQDDDRKTKQKMELIRSKLKTHARKDILPPRPPSSSKQIKANINHHHQHRRINPIETNSNLTTTTTATTTREPISTNSSLDRQHRPLSYSFSANLFNTYNLLSTTNMNRTDHLHEEDSDDDDNDDDDDEDSHDDEEEQQQQQKPLSKQHMFASRSYSPSVFYHKKHHHHHHHHHHQQQHNTTKKLLNQEAATITTTTTTNDSSSNGSVLVDYTQRRSPTIPIVSTSSHIFSTKCLNTSDEHISSDEKNDSTNEILFHHSHTSPMLELIDDEIISPVNLTRKPTTADIQSRNDTSLSKPLWTDDDEQLNVLDEYTSGERTSTSQSMLFCHQNSSTAITPMPTLPQVNKKSSLPPTTQQFYHHHKPSQNEQNKSSSSRPFIPLTLAKYRRISSNIHLTTTTPQQQQTFLGANSNNSSNELINNGTNGIGLNSNTTDSFNEHLMINKRIELLKTPGKQPSTTSPSSSISNTIFPLPPPPPSKRHFTQPDIKSVGNTIPTSSSSLMPIDSTKVTIETIGSKTVSALLRQNATIEPVDTSRGVGKHLVSLLTTASKETSSMKNSYKQSSRDAIIEERYKLDSKSNNPWSNIASNASSTVNNNIQSTTIYNPNKLPPVIINRKSTSKCFLCKKKTGLATTYQCRCGSSFCSEHRYPEAHACAFDYKAEGKRLIERNNPLVTAPKLPKI
ncbi:unnamed protein product [Adineta steineri]|uniref:AN1-type zinc finger protein 4 n=1 Tax=Adineta steineri TaxID=433720 RepID=A0A814X2C9_9BILA|nr:unnamed protein product [Adineta steineri]